MIRRFARPYARAIMDVAASSDRASALLAELRAFERARKGSPELQSLYANPAQAAEAKMGVTRAIAQRLGSSDLTVKVLEVLVRNHRINDVAAIGEALAELIVEGAARTVDLSAFAPGRFG